MLTIILYLQISQGSVARYFRWGGSLYYSQFSRPY